MYKLITTIGFSVAALALNLATADESHAQGKRHRRSHSAAVQADAERSSEASQQSAAAEPARTESAPSSSPSSSSSSASGSTNATESAAAPAGSSDKVGRFMANFKIGPAFGAYNAGHQGAIVLDLGWSVLPNKNTYLLFPLQFEFAQGGGAIILPVGFQYDIAIAKVPGLYLYPRMSIGYAAFISSAAGETVATHFGAIIPEFGAKYVYKGRWNFGGEIFSLPIYFNGAGAAIQYRILLSAGMNF